MTPSDYQFDVSRETEDRLQRFASLVIEENTRQNLVSATTIKDFRERHIDDSLQLLRHIPADASVCDIGSGAGLPGVVLACSGRNVTLVEPRKLRADFLSYVVAKLDLDTAVYCGKAQALAGTFDVITARAVAPLEKLIPMTMHLSHADTRWVLPKGRNANSELEVLKRKWQGDFQGVQSVTNPDAQVMVLSNLKAKAGQ